MGEVFNYSVQNVLVQSGNPYFGIESGNNLFTIDRVQVCSVEPIFPYTEEFDLNGGGDQYMITRPRVNFSFSYFPTKGQNERLIGFATGFNQSAFVNLADQEQNYYLISNLDYSDNIGYTGNNLQVFAVGNALLKNYSFNARVGQPIHATAEFEALNLLMQTGTGMQPMPTVNKQSGLEVIYSGSGYYFMPTNFTTESPVSTGYVAQLDSGDILTIYSPADSYQQYWTPIIGPADIALQFDKDSVLGQSMTGNNACPLYSFSLGFAFNRHEVQSLGWAYPEIRPFQLPLTVNISAEAYLSNIQLDSLNKNLGDSGYSINLICQKFGQPISNLEFHIKNAKLKSQSITSQVGQYSRVKFDWSTSIYDLTRTGTNNSNVYFVANNPQPIILDESILALLFADSQTAYTYWGSGYSPQLLTTSGLPELSITIPYM